MSDNENQISFDLKSSDQHTYRKFEQHWANQFLRAQNFPSIRVIFLYNLYYD
jgi:hypothetical protein